jgi:hypothetical protein
MSTYPALFVFTSLLFALFGVAAVLVTKESYRSIAAEHGLYGTPGTVTMTTEVDSSRGGTECWGDFRTADRSVHADVEVHHSGPCVKGRQVPARLVDMKGRTIPWPMRERDEAWVEGSGSLNQLIGPLLFLLLTFPIAAGLWYLRREWRQEGRLRAAEAEGGGRLLTREEVVRYLRIRDYLFLHLVKADWLRPADRTRTIAGDLDLYQQRDLDALLANPEIDWAAVRATPKLRELPPRTAG